MKKSLVANLVFDIIGAFSGLLSIIFSFIIFFMSNGYFELSERYGGDAYTGIQNAAAQTANNVQDLCELVQMGFGGILLIAGLLLTCHYIKAIITTLSENASNKINNTNEEIPTEINNNIDSATEEIPTEVSNNTDSTTEEVSTEINNTSSTTSEEENV